MASRKQILANRANAQKSTGPVTDAGREKVSRNRTWHGLTGRFEVLPGEDQDAFDNLFNELVKDEKPVGAAELELVRKMAECTWLRQRAARFQEACFFVEERTSEQIAANNATVAIGPQLERFLRYQAHHDRAYARASAELLKRRKERLLAERGFVSQQRAEAEETRRQEVHVYRIDRAKIAIARDQAKLERETRTNEQVKTAAVGQTEPCKPPQEVPIAA